MQAGWCCGARAYACRVDTRIDIRPVLQSPKPARKPTGPYANSRMIVKLELKMTQVVGREVAMARQFGKVMRYCRVQRDELFSRLEVVSARDRNPHLESFQRWPHAASLAKFSRK